MADTPQAPQNPQAPSNYTVDQIAAQIKARRPDLAQRDNDELVRTLVQKQPQFQTFLSTDELTRLGGMQKGFFDFLKDDAQSAASTVGNAVSAAKEWTVDPFTEPWKQGYRDPVSYAQALLEQFGSAAKEGMDASAAKAHAAAQETAQATNPIDAQLARLKTVGYSLAAGLPMMGPAAAQVGEEVGNKQYDTAGGHLAALFLAPKVEEAARGAFHPAPAPGVSYNAFPGIPEPEGGPLSRPSVAQAPPVQVPTPSAPTSFAGMEGPIRPFAPMEARASKGSTIGLPQITGEAPAAQPAEALPTPAEHIEAAGMVNRGQLMRDSGPYGVEHPSFRNVTASINPEDVTSPQAVKQAVARKLNEVADNPPGAIPGQPTLDPVALRNAAQQLQEGVGKPTPTPEPSDINFNAKPVVEAPSASSEQSSEVSSAVESPAEPTPSPSPSIPNAPLRTFDLERFHNQMDAVERAEANLAGPNQAGWQKQNYWQPALEKLRSDFKSGLTDFVRRVDPDAKDAVRSSLQDEVARIREQAKEIQDVRTQNSTAKAMREEMSNSRPIRPWRMEIKVEGQEGYQEVGNQFPGELRDAFHKILGDKVSTEGGIPAEAMDEVKGKAKEGLAAARSVLSQRMEAIASRTGDANIPKSELVDKALREEKQINGRDLLSEVRDLQSILGTQRERLRYASKGEPITDEQGVVRAPGNVKELSLKWANAVLGRTLRKLPDDAAWDRITSNLERRATFLDTISKKLEASSKRSSEASVSLNGSGESAASLEAINRSTSEHQQGIKRVRIDTRSGQETPLIGTDAVDAKAGPYDRIVQRANGSETTLDEGAKARPSRPGLNTTSYAGLPFLDPNILGSVIPDSVKDKTTEVLGNLGREVRDLGFDTVKGAYSVGESLIQAVAPKTGVDADTLNLLFKMKGDIAKENFLAPKLLESYRKNMEALPEEARIAFMDRYKQGVQQATPELQALADTIKQIDRQDFNDIQKFRPGLPFLENHFRLLYKTIPGRDDAGFAGFMGKRPLTGGGGFLHQHVFDTLSEAMQAGGEPITTNPVDMFLLSHANVTRFVEANKMWDEANYQNLRQYVQRGMTPPSDFVRLSDPISKVFFKAASGEGLVNPGEWWVEKGFGRLLENYLSRDHIRESVIGKAVVDAKNIATGVELFGPFHAVFVNNAMASMELGNSLQRVWNLGVRQGDISQVIRGVKETGTAAADFVRGPSGMLSAGRAVISGKSLPEGLLPGPYAEGGAIKEFGAALEKSRRLNDPQDLQTFVNSEKGQSFLKKFPGAEGLFNDVFQGGLNVNLDEGMRSNIVKSMNDSFQQNRYISGAAKIPAAAMYQAMRPLFDEYIPNLKLGMFMRDMTLQLKDRASDILNGSLTREELARQVARRTENVFGEMNFDNLFWNRTMKTSLQMLYRSVTWRFGTLDVAKNALVGQGSALVDAAKTRSIPRIDPNAAYFAGEMLLTGTLAAVTMRMLSGKNPSTMQDLLHPQTGGVDDRGKPIRVDIPTYLSKNISGMAQDFPQGVIKYATGGMSSPIQKFLESWNNKDFYGKFVANPNDPGYKQFVERVAHLLPSLMVSGTADQLEQEGAGPERKALAFAGYTPSSRSLDLTPAEKTAQALMATKLPQGGRYDYDFNHSNAMKRVIAGIKNQQDVSPTILGGLQNGTIRIDDLKPSKLLPRLQQPYLTQMSRRLTLDETLSVYDKATPEERDQLKLLLPSKLNELLKMDPERRDQTVSRLKSLVN